MPTFLRPVKTLGNREYALEKAANPNEPIKSAEVDADLDTIYAGVNGNLDTTNLSSIAGILGSQLSGSAGITGAQIATGTIGGTNIAPTTINTSNLVQGAAVNQFATASATTNLNFSTVETTLVTLPSITTRGGLVLLTGSLGLFLTQSGSSGSTITLRVKRTSTIYTVIFVVSNSNASTVITPIPTPLFIELPTPGTYTYTITGQSSSSAVTINTPPTNAGAAFVMEFA
jgi:hypothetical protein